MVVQPPQGWTRVIPHSCALCTQLLSFKSFGLANPLSLSFHVMTNSDYRTFFEGNQRIPLFMRPYWLDAVAPGQWEVVSAEDDGIVRALWVITRTRHKGLSAISLPPLTQFTGIWLDIDSELPHHKQEVQRQDLLAELIGQIPDVAIFEQKFRYTLEDWIPFYWEGYKQETRYTFRFERPEPERIFKTVSKSFRRNIRSAERLFETSKTDNIAELCDLVEQVFEIRDDKMPYTREDITNAFNALKPRDECQIYKAVRQETGETDAMIFTVWDEETTYYILGGRSGSNTRNSTNLLLWQAIEDAAERGQAFDFEGSMIKGVHKFFQSFGATMTPYHFVYRYKDLAKLKLLVK